MFFAAKTLGISVEKTFLCQKLCSHQNLLAYTVHTAFWVYKFTTAMGEVLIDLVHQYPALWDKWDAMYKDSNYKEAKWKEITEILYLTKEDVIKKWRSLRDTYVRHKNIKSNINVSCSSLVVSKHGLYAGGLGSIPTAITTGTAAGGVAEHVSLNHWLAPPYQGVKLVPAKCWEDRYRCWP